MVKRYEAYPYEGARTETSILEQLVNLLPQVNQSSSLPPSSDMSTRTDSGQYDLNQGQWADNIPELNQPDPPTRITPQDIGSGILNVGSAISPVDPIGFGEGYQKMTQAPSLMSQGGPNVGRGALDWVEGAGMLGLSVMGGIGSKTRPIKPYAEKALAKIGREAVEGGEYLMSKRKKGQEILENVNGKTYNKSFISVDKSATPHMVVDESTIVPDVTLESLKKEKGLLSKINLFKKKAGWKWAKGNEFAGKLAKVGKEDAVISVERGKNHYYTLSTELNSPTTMQTYPARGNPTLRPTTKGVPQFGKVVGQISVRGKKHPLYDRITFGEKSAKPDAILKHGIRDEKDLPTAIRKAQKQKHLIPDLSVRGQGQYVGAPKGVKSMTDIEEMRDNFDAMVAGGVGGADWYEKVKRFTKSVTAGSKEKENSLTEMFALWSAQANPDTNLGWAIQAWNQWARGQRGEAFDMVKTGAQTRTHLGAKSGSILNKALQWGKTRLGPKTQVYHDQMNFNVPKPLTGTNDIWHGRAFSYTNPDGKPFNRGFTQQEHVFLDSETALAVDRANKRKLGGRTDWTPGELQASAWVFAKGQAEFKKYPKKFKDINDAVNWAKKTYPDYLPKYSAFGTSEATPFIDSGHLTAVTKAPFDVKKAYSDDVKGYYGSEQDAIGEGAGLLGSGTREATGIYQPPGGKVEINPAQAHQYLIDMVDAPEGKTINFGTQDILNAVEGLRGYVDMQNGSAWHKFFPRTMSKSGSSDSIRIETGKPLTEEEMRDLSDWAFGKGFYLSDNGKSVVIWPGYDSYPQLKLSGKMKPTKKFPEGKPLEEVVLEDQDKLAQEAVDRGEIKNIGDYEKLNPTGKQVAKLYEGLGETKTRQRVPGYLNELTEMFPHKKIERGRVLSGYIDYHGNNIVSNSALENAGRSLRTKTLFEYLDRVPGVLESLDKSREFKQLITDNILRANEWSKKMNSPLREDHMLALKIIKEKGLVGLKKAMKEGAVLPAVALPILGSAYQIAQEQGVEG